MPRRLLTCLCLLWLAATSLAVAQPPTPPTPRPIGDELFFTARGNLMTSPELARETALEEAQQLLESHLRDRGIVRFVTPSIGWIERNLVIPRREPAETAEVNGETHYRYTLEIRLTSSHLRSFRKMDRVASSAMVLGLVVVAFLASWLYYRLDDWSRGYLTQWIAIGLILGGTVIGGLLLAGLY